MIGLDRDRDSDWMKLREHSLTKLVLTSGAASGA